MIPLRFGASLVAGLAIVIWAQPFESHLGATQDNRVRLEYNVPPEVVQGVAVTSLITLVNEARHPVQVDFGWNRVGRFLMTVTAPDGSRRSARPEPQGGLSGNPIITLPAGQRRTLWLVINEWFDFRLTGEYVVELAFDGAVVEPLPAPTLAGRVSRTAIRVSERNPVRIQQACDRLAGLVVPVTPVSLDAAKALGHFSDRAAFPCLRRLLEADPSMAPMLLNAHVMAGGDEARQELETLSRSSSQELARAARFALSRLKAR